MSNKKAISSALLGAMVALTVAACSNGPNSTDPSATISTEQNQWQKLTDDAKTAESQKDYKTAEELYAKAVVEAQKLGESAPEVASADNNMAGFYFAQGDGQKAEDLYKNALTIREKALGLEHKDIITDLNGLGRALVKQDKFAEAEPIYKRTLVVLEVNKEPVSAALLDEYALVLTKLNRKDEAAKMAKRAKEAGQGSRVAEGSAEKVETKTDAKTDTKGEETKAKQ